MPDVNGMLYRCWPRCPAHYLPGQPHTRCQRGLHLPRTGHLGYQGPNLPYTVADPPATGNGTSWARWWRLTWRKRRRYVP